jgi:hypothetical protein
MADRTGHRLTHLVGCPPKWIFNSFLVFNIVLLLFLHVLVLSAATRVASNCLIKPCVGQVATIPYAVLGNELRLFWLLTKRLCCSEGQDVRNEGAVLSDHVIKRLIFVQN